MLTIIAIFVVNLQDYSNHHDQYSVLWAPYMRVRTCSNSGHALCTTEGDETPAVNRYTRLVVTLLFVVDPGINTLGAAISLKDISHRLVERTGEIALPYRLKGSAEGSSRHTEQQ